MREKNKAIDAFNLLMHIRELEDRRESAKIEGRKKEARYLKGRINRMSKLYRKKVGVETRADKVAGFLEKILPNEWF